VIVFKCDWCGTYQQGTANIIESTAVGYKCVEEICDACQMKFEVVRKKIMEDEE
jgi:hypothetical protein